MDHCDKTADLPLRRFKQAIATPNVRSWSGASTASKSVEYALVSVGGPTWQWSELKLSAEESTWQRGFIDVTRRPAYTADARFKSPKKHAGECARSIKVSLIA